MWATAAPPKDDPLRQGDLIVEVDLPILKRPIPKIDLSFPQANMPLRYKRQPGLVVSSCCSNDREDYIAIAPIQRLGGLTEEQERALLQIDPPTLDAGSYRGYDVDHFRLEPMEGVIENPGPNRHVVASLNRAIPFWGDCSDLRPLRRARMTTDGRRLLRLNLALFWSRVEREDAEELRAAGRPVAFE